MDHIPRLSEVVYVGLCRKIGAPTEVAMRRDIMDMEEMINKHLYMHIGGWMNSGSYREGFRFASSDVDIMFWSWNHKLITDISQLRVYDPSAYEIILMEDSDTPPGFVTLRLLTPQNSRLILSLVPFKDGVFISSSLWREDYFQTLINNEYFQQTNITIHGPCSSGFVGDLEFDHAVCFASIFWPKISGGWVDRCQRHTWPPIPVLEKILRNGCHCVPIGSKIESTSYELECRLSFSQAEKQLVCTMNHTQFLCYGLLKIFLKEVSY
ncbi:uncharacterized protein LOC134266375 [Saccostrea cucullata]|uniref:uncharacterized protein LOC134266375 n=1 Tax=Saccostrea cuccullata TaxID=36930 RepID=UPI002ED1D9FC